MRIPSNGVELLGRDVIPYAIVHISSSVGHKGGATNFGASGAACSPGSDKTGVKFATTA